VHETLASHSSHQANPPLIIERLVCCIHRVLLFPVVTRRQPPDPIPLLQPHYSAFIAPTDRSAPHRYSRLMVVATWASPLTSERLVPAVPHESLCRLHAPFTPVAACPVIRLPAGLSREIVSLPVLTTVLSLTTRLRRVHFRSSLRHIPAQGISLNFSSNAHYHGS